jgi:hypothetical protein
MKKKLYVGCAISGLPPEKRKEFLKMIERLKVELSRHFEILEFIGTALSSPKDTYVRDIAECVMHADYMLAICDHPSLGLGYEMATAIEKRDIPVLAFAHKNSSVSRLIVGIHGKKFLFLRYDSTHEIVQHARKHLLPREAA